MSITGVVRYGRLFARNLELRRTITSRLGENAIDFVDEFTNLGNGPVPHAWLLHINLGYPLVQEGTEFCYDSTHSILRARQDGLHGRSQLENDRRFHLAIAEMTENSVLVRLVGELFDGRHSPISSRMSASTEDSQAWKAAFAEHEAIYRALEARDPQAAVAAMLHHLSASHARWTGETQASVP